ncbi:MAG: phytanoyl-CoA dioxygenase family protein [Legionella sp.]|nr:phytanoyl-CoA dioxygenase family protein [Legionella sp.]
MDESNRYTDSTHLEHYERNGVVCLRQVLSKTEIESLRAGIEQNLRELSHRAKIASRPDDPGHFVEDFCTWQNNPHYREVIFNSALGKIAAHLTQSERVRLYHDHLLVKEPGTRQPTPWHQDQPYYNIAGRQNCSFWIPVDPIKRASSLEFVTGSHHGPWLMPRTFMDNQAKWFPEGELTELPDINADRTKFPIVSFEMEPGDVLCFHMLTLHAARGVDEENRRRVFSVRFLGDDMVHAPRNWPTSPDFPGLADQLPKDAPLDHPLFPIVWEQK